MSNYGYFEYNGKRSTDFGLYIDPNLTFSSPAVSGEFVDVPGLDGQPFVPDGNLKNVSKSFAAYVDNKSKSIEVTASEISNWLKSDVGWKDLFFSGDQDYLYQAIYTEEFDVTNNIESLGKTVLTFTCKPYKFHKEGLKEIVLVQNQVLKNAGTRQSKPLIKIVGNGDIRLNLGSSTILLKGVDNSIVVDCLSESVYHPGNGVAQWSKMFSYPFPKLALGNTSVSWSGNVDSVSIVPRWEAIVG